MTGAYYNEHDKFAANWLRNLIKAGLIADGEVDERSIEQVEASDLSGFAQCHFFAGIGVWSYALRASGWADDSPVWTGSCPCQSFSASGKRGGFSDKRHLWPAWFRLIRECKPDVCFGEQVASKDGLAWLDIVSSDMEGAGYTFGAADMCAAGVGAPHIRQRLYFVAESEGVRSSIGIMGSKVQAQCGSFGGGEDKGRGRYDVADGGSHGELADSERTERRPSLSRGDDYQRQASGREQSASGIRECGAACDLGDTHGQRLQRQWPDNHPQGRKDSQRSPGLSDGTVHGFWRDADWLWCRDEKYRPVESGTFPLASGATNRVGRLRGYGNALNAEVAKEFIAAYMEIGAQ